MNKIMKNLRIFAIGVFVLFLLNLNMFSYADELHYLPPSAENITTFKSVEEMMEKFNDYNIIEESFKILSTEPLHIQLAPVVFPGELPCVIEEVVNEALIYGIYRSFIHTNIDHITVSSVPCVCNLDPNIKLIRYANEYKRTISKGRQEALTLVKRYISIDSLSDMVTGIKYGNDIIPNQWVKDFDCINYSDQGYPGITRFVNELAKSQKTIIRPHRTKSRPSGWVKGNTISRKSKKLHEYKADELLVDIGNDADRIMEEMETVPLSDYREKMQDLIDEAVRSYTY